MQDVLCCHLTTKFNCGTPTDMAVQRYFPGITQGITTGLAALNIEQGAQPLVATNYKVVT